MESYEDHIQETRIQIEDIEETQIRMNSVEEFMKQLDKLLEMVNDKCHEDSMEYKNEVSSLDEDIMYSYDEDGQLWENPNMCTTHGCSSKKMYVPIPED